MIKVSINRTCARLQNAEPLTAGMMGKTLDVEFSADWAGLSKTAVFSNGDKTIDVLESEWNGNTINIPWEVLETPNRAVSFGIYGHIKNGDDIILAIPTIYTSLGRVYLGVDPDGDESIDPSLPVYAQLDLRVTELEEHGGGGTSDHRQLTNRNDADQHPMSAITGLQSALDGKQPSGDYVTSGELDALADIVDEKLSDAPSDGKQYARKNGGWSEVVGGGSGGGGMVVNFVIQVSGEELVVSADKTPAEVIAAALTGPVMGTVISPDLGMTEINPLGGVAFNDILSPAFWLMDIDSDGVHYFISAENGSWVAAFI